MIEESDQPSSKSQPRRKRRTLSAVEAEKYDDTNLTQTSGVTGSNPAYIMFTSGSTGFPPKGAVMTHANVLNLIEWSRETYSITHDDVLTNVNPLYFDNSVFDFYAALFNGARLVPFSKAEVSDPKVLVEKIDAAELHAVVFRPVSSDLPADDEGGRRQDPPLDPPLCLRR